MTLCCKTITDYSFNHLNINRIQIKCATKNKKSNAIPNRLNYFFEGIEREGEFINDKYFDLNLYSALKNEW
jgi:ribosomal-protein-serine acetyltransferase